MADYCSRCHKVWTLSEPSGTCQWCGKIATANHRTTHANRVIKVRRKAIQKPVEHSGDYQRLEGRWAFYYQVAVRYSYRVPSEDR